MSEIYSEEEQSALEGNRGLSGMVICCAVVSSLLVGMGLTAVLTSSLGIAPTCCVVLTIFFLPILWAIFRRTETVNGEGNEKPWSEQNGSTSMDRTWVISFWCVCSLVLLMIANQA